MSTVSTTEESTTEVETGAEGEAPRGRRSDLVRDALAPSVVVVAAALALVVVRLLPRLESPTLYAEDGTVFYAGYLEGGVGAVLDPYAGYLHVLPRLLVTALAPVGLDALPLALALAALVTQVGVSAIALSPRLAWLLPTRTARATAFLAVLALPPAWEVSGNVANTIFVGALGLVLLGLSRDPSSRRGLALDVALLLVLGLSGPVVVLLLPLHLARLARLRTRYSAVSTAAVVLAAAVQAGVYATSSRETVGGATLATYPEVAVLRVVGAWLLGERPVRLDGESAASLLLVGAWTALLVVTALAWRPLVGAGLLLVAASLVGAATHAYGPGLIADAYTNQRHVFLPTAVLALVLTSAAWTAPARATRVLAALLLLSGAGGVLAAGASEAWGPVADPSAVARFESCVESGSGPCSLPITPAGWVLVVEGR